MIGTRRKSERNLASLPSDVASRQPVAGLRNGAEVSLNLQSRSALENLRDRAALVCAQIGMSLLTVCLRRGSSCYIDPQFRDAINVNYIK
jgi:hypothetical protein